MDIEVISTISPACKSITMSAVPKEPQWLEEPRGQENPRDTQNVQPVSNASARDWRQKKVSGIMRIGNRKSISNCQHFLGLQSLGVSS